MKRQRPKTSRSVRKRVMLVDDHPMTRDGIAQLIDREPDLEVAWQAATASEALAAARRGPPDLALVDVTLPDRSGIDLVREFRALWPDVPILVVSMHDESFYGERALRAGARGYISKAEGGMRLMQAIRQVLGGEIFVSEKTRARILESYSGRHSNAGSALLGSLTDREFEIFQLIGSGMATREIADRMKISPKTVETHRGSIKVKLKIGTAAELIAFSARWVESQPGGVA